MGFFPRPSACSTLSALPRWHRCCCSLQFGSKAHLKRHACHGQSGAARRSRGEGGHPSGQRKAGRGGKEETEPTTPPFLHSLPSHPYTPPFLLLLLSSPEHMFTVGALTQNNTKRGQDSQQVIYCRGTPRLQSASGKTEREEGRKALCNERRWFL